MLFNSFFILAATLLPLSEPRAISSSEILGFKLIYKNLGTLPNTDNTIEPTSYDTVPSTPSTCASMCASILSCKFFVIYAPFDGTGRSHRLCQYYSEADPYQNSDGTQFTHQVRELCGYQKQSPSNIGSDSIGNAAVHSANTERRRSENFDGTIPSNSTPKIRIPPTNNCTNATYTISKRRDTANSIPYPVEVGY